MQPRVRTAVPTKGPFEPESPATATFSCSVTLRDSLSLFVASGLLFSLAVVSLDEFSSALQLPSLAIETVIVYGCLKLLFRNFFFHFCVMKVEREGTYFFGVAGKLWRKIRRRRCGSCCFSSLLFVFSTLLVLYMWCEECKWWRECFVLVEDGRYKLWRYFLVGKVWSWFCTSTYREVFLL